MSTYVAIHYGVGMSFSNDGHYLPSMDGDPLDILVNIRYNAIMKTEKEKHKVTVLIPVEIVTQLKQEAEKHQRSFNGELVWALQQYLEQQKGKKSCHWSSGDIRPS